MSQADFRRRLARLLEDYLAEHGDPWWLTREISQAATLILDDLRCDLDPVEVEEESPF